MKALDRIDTRASKKVGVTMKSYCKNGVVGRVESKVDTGDSYKLNLLIFKDNHTKNLLFCNLADVLAIFFGDLSLILIDFRFSPTFLIFFSHLAVIDGINDCKSLNFTSFGGPATYNLGNIFAFYY